MNTKSVTVTFALAGTVVLVASGCVERRVVYVPTYPVPPAYSGQPVYNYSNQTAYVPAPGTNVSAGVSAPAPQPMAPGAAVQSEVPPPAPQTELIPAQPGPGYAWTPGYWSWSGTSWVWVGGNWVVRPRYGAVWVPGHWARRGFGWVWIGGHWR